MTGDSYKGPAFRSLPNKRWTLISGREFMLSCILMIKDKRILFYPHGKAYLAKKTLIVSKIHVGEHKQFMAHINNLYGVVKHV